MDAPMPRRARQPTQLDRIRVPLYVGFGGLVVIVLEQIYDKVAGGGLLALGPLRVTYIAGGLIAFGVLGVMKRLIADG
jgi:predicted membrane channel-forming protein YqfA (hemolysin III family)